MISLRRLRQSRGFTLVELAIVLSVAATLFIGLYRLLSSGNQQIKDSASASQQAQLISSVKSFLSSPDGGTFMANLCGAAGCAVGTNKSLPLPTTLVNAAGTAGVAAVGGAHPVPASGCQYDANITAVMTTTSQAATWCSSLPPGFWAGTVNSYGQTYAMRFRSESVSNPNTAPVTYSFLITTSGGNIISDTSGGRISSLIGGDGGFMYSTFPCNGAGFACGAYGAWSIDPTTYGFAAGAVAVGDIVSRSYLAPEQSAGTTWLSRSVIDSGVPPVYNTMLTNLYLNQSGIYGIGGGAAKNVLYGTGDLTKYGGRIANLNRVELGNNDTSYDPAGATPANLENEALSITGPADRLSPGTTCQLDHIIHLGPVAPGGSDTFVTKAGDICHAALRVNGNQITAGMVIAYSLYAPNLIYNATIPSDLRIKKDIRSLGSALDSIMKLKPVIFQYKKDDRDNLGFIAQDIQKVYPQIVKGQPGGIWGVEYIQLLAPLVSAVQELKTQNDQLKEQLHEQESQIKQLQKDK